MSDDELTIEDEIDDNHKYNYDKYRIAGQIVRQVINKLKDEIKSGDRIYDLCKKGDKYLQEQLDKTYAKKKLEYGKGIAFPTCISVNDMIAYYSPLVGDQYIVLNGDLLNIELGAHIDGFACFHCETIVIKDKIIAPLEFLDKIGIAHPKEGETPIYLTRNGVMVEEGVDKLIKEGEEMVNLINKLKDHLKQYLKYRKKNTDVPDAIKIFCKKNNVNVLVPHEDFHDDAGILSYQMSQNEFSNDDEDIYTLITTNSVIKVEERRFDYNQVFAIDMAITKGSGRTVYKDTKPTIYRRNPEVHTKLRLKSARQLISYINTKGKFPFNINNIDHKSGKMGLTECMAKKSIIPYNILYEETKNIVARLKMTIVMRKNKTTYLTI